MPNLVKIRAAMAAKHAEIKAKDKALSTAPADQRSALNAEHEALCAEYAELQADERRRIASDQRDADIAAHPATASDPPVPGAEPRAAEPTTLSAVETMDLQAEARAAGMPDAAFNTAVRVAGATPAAIRQAILADLAQRQRAGTGGVRPAQSAGAVLLDEREKVVEGAENALMHRHNPVANKLSDTGRHFRGMSLLDMAREFAERDKPGQTRGMYPGEIAQRSLQSTSDFPLTLANVTGKVLRQGYQASPRTFLPLGRRQDLPDFKPAFLIKVGDAPALLAVTENSEFKRGAMGEGQETISLKTYGRVVGMSRQMIVNDSLGAFTKIPEAFGVQSSNLESDIVWAMILSNPVMLTDGVTLFNTAHKNIATGANSALYTSTAGPPPVITPNAAAITAGRIAMSKQLGDGDTPSPLNLRPKFIAIPPELETITAQILGPGLNANVQGQVVPDFIRDILPVEEPRLSTGVRGIQGSATAFYLFADPGQIDTFVYSYLEGQDGPYVESRTGFDVDGMEIKVRHDFAASAIEPRAMFLSAGQ